MYPCPNCGHATKILPREPHKKAIGLIRTRKCLWKDCGKQFQTQENERSAIHRAVLATFEKEFGKQMKELRELIVAARRGS